MRKSSSRLQTDQLRPPGTPYCDRAQRWAINGASTSLQRDEFSASSNTEKLNPLRQK